MKLNFPDREISTMGRRGIGLAEVVACHWILAHMSEPELQTRRKLKCWVDILD